MDNYHAYVTCSKLGRDAVKVRRHPNVQPGDLILTVVEPPDRSISRGYDSCVTFSELHTPISLSLPRDSSAGT
jgi:hypothetical protein